MADVNVRTQDAATESRKVAEQEYAKLIGGNEYKPTASEYSATHKNALSDGDDKGKGETSTIGSKTDIVERSKLTTMNMYGQGREYKNPD